MSESKCSDIATPSGGTTTIEVPVFQNTPIFLFVDGYGGTSGDYTLDVEISLAVCGNGVAELPEVCDDGNNTDGDGCSATCTLEMGGVIDACPGQPFVLSGPAGAPRKIGFAGDTSTHTAPSQGAPGCYFAAGKNSVYAVKSDITGSVKAALVTAYPKAALHARSECSGDTYQLGCASGYAPGAIDIQFPVKAGQWFYLFVDGQENGGPYSLAVEVSPAACGNHVLDGNEQCDDGNATDGDGCTAACTLEPLSGVNTCPGRPLALVAQPDGSRAASITGTTVGLTNHVRACQSLLSSPTSGAPDAIFAVTPDIDGLLTLDVTGPFNTIVSFLDACVSPEKETAGTRDTVVACSYASWVPPSGKEPWVADGLGSIPKQTRGPVLANRTYYVVVDSATQSGTPSAGPFELSLRITPPTCGNGIVEGTETCDDGGTEDNDGCSAACMLEPTGPRNTCATADNVTLVQKPGDTWEASINSGTTNLTRNHNFGSTESGAGGCWARGPDAFFKVTAPAAGVLRAKANSAAFDVILGLQRQTCTTTTAPTACMNSGPKGTEEIVSAPVAAGDVLYIVVDSPMIGVNGCTADPFSPSWAADCEKLQERGRFTLDVAITPSGCGDGFFVPSATEECDDGNNVSGDGCSATCKLEPLAGVDTCPGTTLALTGAGTQPRKGVITFDTSALNANYAGACGGNGKDGVVRVVPNVSGVLRAKLRNMPTGTLYARSVCEDPSTEYKKSSGTTCPSVVHDTVSFGVTANTEYFLFVDGLDGATGVPTLDVTVDP